MSGKFTYRSTQNEHIDNPAVPKKMFVKNLKELDILNRFFWGHRISIKGIQRLITDKTRHYHVVDLGCGSGDSMLYMAAWARKNNFIVKFTGVDNNPNAILYLADHCKDFPEISGLCMGYEEFLKRNTTYDIVHCSLFCHHLNNQALHNLFMRINKVSKVGFVINDLIRSSLAYNVTRIFTTLSNATPLAKNDGPISVLRGFKVQEFKALLKDAGCDKYTIQKTFGFRFLAVGQSD